MKILIGLGNPGLEYEDTRLYIGFEVIDVLRKKFSPVNVIKTNYYKGWEVVIGGKEAVLVKPKTFINNSGIALKKLFERFDGELEDYTVIHDDLDIEVGKLKIINKKSAGGHKGVASIITELGSRDFIRVRVGIGRGKVGQSNVEYVLSPFSNEEKPLIKEAVHLAALACEEIVRSNVAKAMTLYNV